MHYAECGWHHVQAAEADIDRKGHTRSNDHGIPSEYICPITQVSAACIKCASALYCAVADRSCMTASMCQRQL